MILPELDDFDKFKKVFKKVFFDNFLQWWLLIFITVNDISLQKKQYT